MLNRNRMKFSKGLLLGSVLFSCPVLAEAPTHGIAVRGDLKYPEGFSHFEYVNPDAPRGGKVTLSHIGGFDSFNPFYVKGVPAPGSSLLHCSLLSPSLDEPMSFYGYAAESLELSPDRTSITFTLNPEATFSDGSPVTADDVIYSFHTLQNDGLPLFRLYYQDVKGVQKTGQNKVQFTFKDGENRELPLILGQLPILSKSYYTKHGFTKADLTAPVGCGPYTVAQVSPGSSVKYKRKNKWWGDIIPSQSGLYNFDIHYKNYRDLTVWFEAFKSHDYDFREENVAKNWANGYTFPAVKDGRVILSEIAHGLPAGMQMFTMNLRRPLFQDPKVRLALNYAFDYEWANENLFHNSYKRNASYFENSDLAARGVPERAELEYLEQFRGRIPDEVFTAEFINPTTDGTGNNRKNLAQADALLKEAGWIVRNGKRVNEKTGQPFRFEFMSSDPAYERILLAYQRSLSRLGIDMEIRNVNPAQYIERLESQDYDMIMFIVPQSETPGNEQRDLWGSKNADVRGTRNVAGIKNPVIDAIVEDIIDAQTREELLIRTHALDRVLLWNHYGVPGWFFGKSRIAYWDKFKAPAIKPKDGIGFMTWWVDPEKEKALNN